MLISLAADIRLVASFNQSKLRRLAQTAIATIITTGLCSVII
jgi:hypothetical protein